ncbi:hypothetical protein GE061_008916 [Apolygus lucorum]|uniref:Uncharacterized protein n=1 Tax=Apolygus lucorum TaxID=248454 RepID=A0A8S9XZ28_APOLU|nr:hypothetical protein GE061_008916 [Apolygus lucorum]
MSDNIVKVLNDSMGLIMRVALLAIAFLAVFCPSVISAGHAFRRFGNFAHRDEPSPTPSSTKDYADTEFIHHPIVFDLPSNTG